MAQARDALWAAGHDEAVEVNQRALIDKVLARYSGEFTVFRELLQNSDDAQSKQVEIHFQSVVSDDAITLPNLKTALCQTWIFKNNGVPFTAVRIIHLLKWDLTILQADWNRLKKIAEGNPDEDKIGAFGVGFYSLFSVTEQPLVKSGAEWMGFFWKDGKDQLFARRGALPPDDTAHDQAWTSFEMPLRQPVPMPVAFDFARFLCSSITFMTHLSQVRVYFDEKCLVKISKQTGIPKALGLPKGLQSRSRLGTMNVAGISSTSLRIEAEIMRWVYTSGTEKPKPQSKQHEKQSNFFSWFSFNSTPQRESTPLPEPPEEPANLLKIVETSVSLSVFSAQVNVRLDKAAAAELHRATKKNPPNSLKYDLIYTAKDEYDASRKEDELQPFTTGSVFQGLRADLEGLATRMFIGHATGQTTGLAGHMSSRFISTVERESLDFVDRHIATWNKELLWVGGYLARAAYERELSDIRELWSGSVKHVSSNEKDDELQKWLQGRALHALCFFTFHPSTPSADVSSLLEAAFFSCGSNQDFPLISTVGVRQASAIRYPNPTFRFLKELPVLPDSVISEASGIVKSLQHRGLVKPITFHDVLTELRARPLNEVDMIACLNWWIQSYNATPDQSMLSIRSELLSAAVLIMEDQRVLQLSSIKHILNPRSFIPLDGPLPDDLLPVAISKHLPIASLSSAFPWTDLPIQKWLRHICDVRASCSVEFNLSVSAIWAERVLVVLASAWPSLSNEVKAEIKDILRSIPCIPTSAGLKLPEESYFLKADLFHDLPVVTFASGTTLKPTLERVLEALGVRKHVDLQIVFNRMIKTKEWSIFELTRYLVEVKSSLTQTEWNRLKMTAAFVQEANPGEASEKRKQSCAKDLYEPSDTFRQLGLPVIDWGEHKWRANSDQAKLLFDLGLLRYPPLKVLINLCANSDEKTRPIALKYLIDNLPTKYLDYDPGDFYDIPFLPALRDKMPTMGSPKEVVANAEYVAFGVYLVFALGSDAALKLKIQQAPPTTRIVALLESTRPQSQLEARKWFTILAGRISEFSGSELKRLSQTAMVPVTKDGKESSLQWLPPSQCFFGLNSQAGFHSKIFVFVDFGITGNRFLAACGTKDSPSIEQVSQMLLADPHHFYKLADSPTNFLSELRNLAINHRSISSATLARMKTTPVLLALHKPASSGDVEYNDNPIEQYDLKRADQIVVVDDNNSLQYFGEFLYTAPQEDILEEFYLLLGSRKLSSLVKEEYKTSAELKDSRVSAEIRALILERLPLFLHEHTHARTRVSFNWLNNDNHFVVTSYGKVAVTKTINFGDIRKSKTQEASAVAKRVGSGPILLWIAGNSQVDMYEVATSLNRLLFDSPKTNDALLFMTILSTDLKALKRRGYNVDRILKQQHAIRQEALAQQQAQQAKLNANSNQLISAPPAPALPSIPTTTTTPLQPTPAQQTSNSPPAAEKAPPLSTGVMSSLKRRLNATIHPNEKSGGLPPPPIPDNSRPRPSSSKSATPLSHISSNINMAIQACRPESGNLLRNREQMQQVNESLNEGYCDISGRAGDLTAVGEVSGIKVFASHEVPNLHALIPSKYDSLNRFAPIIRGLAQVYTLPLTSLHIFYDVDGGLIAFNRGGSLFLNLRFFESWHDADVKAGRSRAAYISWYFTLAHEIAHNLVQPHNSEHEFYFSAICEKYFGEISKLLA
ncbi:hypothetical protein MIND_00045600 [Mycena indigotica]|uniref:Sacsin/Nov domain-containing protein n=1 Tax=Mycena indigotica TaxID=2126181 RepID=A0A8H6TGG9_9AGAR|nr:uncharacterized protein MIND_00045600 [Mycena indigotica]KAF7315310.1 hypothetical protein MIND_00045600 [Mycena indigotica]